MHQGGGDVGARAGPENQHVLEAVAKDRVRPLVEVFLLRHRGHRLVKDVVHLDDRVGAVLADGDLVVRRPQRAARHDVDEDQRDGQQGNVDEHRRAGRRAPRRRRRDSLRNAEVPGRLRRDEQQDRRREGEREPDHRAEAPATT